MKTWRSNEATAEECIDTLGFDPHAGQRDAEGKVIPSPPCKPWVITAVNHETKTITVERKPKKPKKRRTK